MKQLIDVALTLQMDATITDISGRNIDPLPELIFSGTVVIPGGRPNVGRAIMVMVKGTTTAAADARLLIFAFKMAVCGMKGGLPPSAVSRLIAVRSAK